MNGWTLFFTISGVAAVSAQLTRIIVWLDTPRRRRWEKQRWHSGA